MSIFSFGYDKTARLREINRVLEQEVEDLRSQLQQERERADNWRTAAKNTAEKLARIRDAIDSPWIRTVKEDAK